MLYQITDWDDAYTNNAYIPDGHRYVARWRADAESFRLTARRESIGNGDLFLPVGTVKGLAVFIHGGYWLAFDPGYWSHLAAGPLARGWAVALPAYPLAQTARLTQMAVDVAGEIVQAAERVNGPIALTGHSAGGQLAARMICTSSPLPRAITKRIVNCVPISPLGDLRPLLRTAMNQTLAIDAAEAAAESPVLLTPLEGVPVTTWVGDLERPEFIRQAQLLANIWAGLGAATECVIDRDRHHFNIIAPLAQPDSTLTSRLLDQSTP